MRILVLFMLMFVAVVRAERGCLRDAAILTDVITVKHETAIINSFAFHENRFVPYEIRLQGKNICIVSIEIERRSDLVMYNNFVENFDLPLFFDNKTKPISKTCADNLNVILDPAFGTQIALNNTQNMKMEIFESTVDKFIVYKFAIVCFTIFLCKYPQFWPTVIFVRKFLSIIHPFNTMGYVMFSREIHELFVFRTRGMRETLLTDLFDVATIFTMWYCVGFSKSRLFTIIIYSFWLAQVKQLWDVCETEFCFYITNVCSWFLFTYTFISFLCAK